MLYCFFTCKAISFFVDLVDFGIIAPILGQLLLHFIHGGRLTLSKAIGKRRRLVLLHVQTEIVFSKRFLAVIFGVVVYGMVLFERAVERSFIVGCHVGGKRFVL